MDSQAEEEVRTKERGPEERKRGRNKRLGGTGEEGGKSGTQICARERQKSNNSRDAIRGTAARSGERS